MGTRNLTMVYVNGDYKIAQYGQWDGYPSGNGITVLEFARDKMDRKRFTEAVLNCEIVDPDELRRRWKEFGADENGMISIDNADKFAKVYPQLNRDMGADILEFIQEKGGGEIKTELNFAADSLFCEWAYVIDLDKNTLEVYVGFNQEPLPPTERFASLPLADREHRKKPEDLYYPIKLAHAWPLDALPSNEDFLAILEPPEDE